MFPPAEDRPGYELRVAARLVGLSPLALRRLERLGLLASGYRRPPRGRAHPGYTRADLERARLIRRLVDDLGVNLAGVEVILNMRAQILALRAELARLRRDPGG
jgi:MerR family transcriptional regulator/heat shock protein HspR